MTTLAFSFFPFLLPAIEAAKRLGSRVICIHHHDRVEPIARRYVDEFYRVEPYAKENDLPPGHRRYIDLNQVIEIARRENVRFILPSACGNEAREIGLINEALGLPGLNFQQSLICVDKIEWNQFLIRNDLPCTSWTAVTSEDYARGLQRFSDFPYPAVIKPDEGSHSVLTRTVRSHAELREFFAELGGFQIAPFSRMLLQKHLPGEQALAEVVVHEGQIVFFAIRDVVPDEFPRDLAVGSLFPSGLNDEKQNEIFAQVKTIVSALQVAHGVFAFDFIFDRDGHAICIDANPRPSGSGPRMLDLAFGFDYIEMIVRLRAGQRVEFPSPSLRASAYQLLRVKPGRIREVHFPDPAAHDVVFHNASFWQATQAGTEITATRNISNTKERVFASGATPLEAWEKTRRFIDAVEVSYETSAD